jgi:hypothetical protein
MKKYYFFVLAVMSIVSSCSNDTDDTTAPSNFSTPLKVGNFWTYDVKNGTIFTRDSLYISNDIVIDSKTYKKFNTKNPVASGFYSSSLRNNALRQEDGKLYLTGDLTLNMAANLPFDVDLSVSDFIIFYKDAANNQPLNAVPKSGTINETFNNFPLEIKYSLQVFGGETFTSFTSPDGTVYSNVKSIQVRLNVGITTVFPGFPVTITALTPQDVVVSTQYFADGIGMVYAKTITSYSVDATIANRLGIPPSETQTQEEFLDTYLVN